MTPTALIRDTRLRATFDIMHCCCGLLLLLLLLLLMMMLIFTRVALRRYRNFTQSERSSIYKEMCLFIYLFLIGAFLGSVGRLNLTL